MWKDTDSKLWNREYRFEHAQKSGRKIKNRVEDISSHNVSQYSKKRIILFKYKGKFDSCIKGENQPRNETIIHKKTLTPKYEILINLEHAQKWAKNKESS